ncbi:MAG: HAD-IC family P-type ATPase [Christensenellaceae bacterium]|jgi:cation-transporting ATPase E|nr:HAD-IC family P-type ATPase [Christensenellaceae bacterium]
MATKKTGTKAEPKIEPKTEVATGAQMKPSALRVFFQSFVSLFYTSPKAPFSNTVFTDGNKREIARYKKYYKKLQLKDSKKKTKSEHARFNTSITTGLKDDDVKARVKQGLINYTQRGSTKTVGRILFTNIFTWFNLICFVSVGLLVWVEQYTSCFFIVITAINILIGIIQELKAKYTIEKLSLISQSKAKVIRNGERKDIVLDDVVVDDILVLSNGQQIPADSIVVDGMIEVNESLLTGESIPIQKGKGATVYAGSFVVSGTCLVRVEKVSSGNYVQKLAKGATRYVRPKSELLSSLSVMIKTISFAMVVLCTSYIVRQVVGGTSTDRSETIAYAIGAVIGMIPSGMFLLTSLALAVGVINLAKSRTLVQELYCIEMLARVDTLCLDKTGTITNGTMKVCDVVEVKNSSNYTIREIIASMSFALNDNNQTAIAIQDHFGSQMILRAKKTLPFSSSRKLSAVSFEEEGTYIIGAPEFILKERNEKVDERVRRFASQGYRVLILARSPQQMKTDVIPTDAKPIAIITLQDQIRTDAPATIAWFKQNGVDVRVISGDNPITVSEVARRAGVAGAEKYISLEGLTPLEVRNIAHDYTVFGRVSPEQKLILIKEFKNAGRTVAMTGDGVNDILALREADCSVAMAAGSEAARNVSHLVLLDNDFASMPKVVAQGRRVVNNIQKTSSIYLFKTLFVILLVTFCIITAEEYPFKPINMFLIESFVIGIPSFALALEINDKKIKGKFLLTVLRNSFAGAIVVIINVIVLYIFKKIGETNANTLFAITNAQFKTLLIFSTTITGVFMLWKIIQPLNLYRTSLMLLITVLIGVVAWYGRGILEIGDVDTNNILLLIILLQASYPLIAFINAILSKIHLDKVPILNKINEKLDR